MLKKGSIMDKNEREGWEKELDRLEKLERRSYSYKAPNSYKSVFMTLMGILGIGCFGLLVWLVGNKSGKDKCRR